jgi:addiction module HigA family antidote
MTWYVTGMNGSIHAGEILLEEYLRPMGISQNAMARAMGVPPRAVNEIVLGKRSITPMMSIRMGAFFGQSDGFWHGIQVECDFRALAHKRLALVEKVRPAGIVDGCGVRCGETSGPFGLRSRLGVLASLAFPSSVVYCSHESHFRRKKGQT